MCGMATRLQGRAVRRPSLPLTEADEHDLAELKDSPSLLQALSQMLDLDINLQSATEAAVLHAIFRAGLAHIRDAALEAGYAQLAAEQAEETAARRVLARRRRPTWADEA